MYAYAYALAIYMYISDLTYLSKLLLLRESEHISDCDLEACINHFDKLREDFNIRFGDLDNMHVPEWLVSPFDMKIDN